MGVEFEVKFRASDAQLQQIIKAYPGNWQRICMQTTYYDTPDGALSAKHYTLRLRMENGNAVCTLKAPTQGFGRGEYETACDSIYDAIPTLCKLSGLGQTLLSVCDSLVPVCGAKFTRQAMTLTLPECTVELALDSGMLYGGGKEAALCELEAELKGGSREALLAFAKSLSDRYGLVLEQRSKFRRALALARVE